MEITVTDTAQTEIVKLMTSQESTVTGVRITAEAVSPLKANYRLAFVAEGQEDEADEKINPAIASHGGQVSLADIQDNKVFLQFGGGCQGCGMVDVTLKQGVEVMIKEAVPEVAEVLDITDHEKGVNPYYESSQ